MVSFPNCKINIGLNILRKRPDGYHDLQSIFYPLPIKDALEIIEANNSAKEITFSSSGIHVPGEEQNNLCIKAFQLLKKDFPGIPPVKMHLHKTIPMGAGLGGGSADAAFTLQLLNVKFELKLSPDQLISYALALGSDCPFFIVNKPCYATGRGERLEEIPLDLASYKILIVNPVIHIQTGMAFSAIVPAEVPSNLKDVIKAPIIQWRELIFNDFETAVFNLHPGIGAIKAELYEQGALYASMSGTGSTLYGIFEKDSLPSLKFPAHYFCRWV